MGLNEQSFLIWRGIRMNILFGKKNKVYEMIEKYLATIGESIDFFGKTIEIYFEKGLTGEFREMIGSTHLSESLADDIRRDMELALYEKSLIPESRGDILGLIEATDKVLNKAQSVLYQIETESLRIPDELKDDFMQLVHVNVSAYKSAIEGFKTLFVDINNVQDNVKEVDKKESSSDRMERDFIRKIFASNYDIGQKILLKELIIEVGSISDRSEDVTDRLTIVAAKRMF
jgi:hypothetical protein